MNSPWDIVQSSGAVLAPSATNPRPLFFPMTTPGDADFKLLDSTNDKENCKIAAVTGGSTISDTNPAVSTSLESSAASFNFFLQPSFNYPPAPSAKSGATTYGKKKRSRSSKSSTAEIASNTRLTGLWLNPTLAASTDKSCDSTDSTAQQAQALQIPESLPASQKKPTSSVVEEEPDTDGPLSQISSVPEFLAMQVDQVSDLPQTSLQSALSSPAPNPTIERKTKRQKKDTDTSTGSMLQFLGVKSLAPASDGQQLALPQSQEQRMVSFKYNPSKLASPNKTESKQKQRSPTKKPKKSPKKTSKRSLIVSFKYPVRRVEPSICAPLSAEIQTEAQKVQKPDPESVQKSRIAWSFLGNSKKDPGIPDKVDSVEQLPEPIRNPPAISDGNSAKALTAPVIAIKKKPTSDKAIHPFFLKKKDQKAVKQTSQGTEAPEPAFLNRQLQAEKPLILKKASASASTLASFASAFNSSKPMLRRKPAPWPKSYQMHVRGLDEPAPVSSLSPLPAQFKSLLNPQSRSKRKGTFMTISRESSILNTTIGPIVANCITQLNRKEEEKLLPRTAANSFPPPNIRKPTQIKMSPEKIKNLILRTIVNPASIEMLKDMLAKAPHTLSSFEAHVYETATWVAKYAPQKAHAVVTSGTSATEIRDWVVERTRYLGSLKKSEYKKLVEQRRTRRKVRNRTAYGDEMDDFIVYDDYVEEEILDSSDGEGSETGGVIDTTSPEVLILCGPSGSGKTSAVYAACKELDVFVMEANPGEKRSSKLVAERFDGMSTSHLVHKTSNKGETAKNAGGLMGFFGKAKPSKQQPKNEIHADIPTIEPGNKKKSSAQDGVIFLEEVDTLFEDESSFWPAIERFLETSKRPVIVSCTDISRLSSDFLARHGEGLLHFFPADLQVQIDALWAIALCEGHLLDREALEALVLYNGYDMRKSVNHLQFWCQMALGDRFSAMNWIYKTRELPLNDPANGIVYNRFLSQGTFLGLDSLVCSGDDQSLLFGVEGLEKKLYDGDSSKQAMESQLLESYVEDLEFEVVTNTSTSDISLDDWVSLSESLSCADILETNVKSLMSVHRLVAVATDGDSNALAGQEFEMPQDHILGDYYTSHDDSLPISSTFKPHSFETRMYPSVITQAFTAFNSGQSGNCKIQLACKRPQREPLESMQTETIRTRLASISEVPSITMLIPYNHIDCSTSSVLATEIGAYARTLARLDVQRVEFLGRAKAGQFENIIVDPRDGSMCTFDPNLETRNEQTQDPTEHEEEQEDEEDWEPSHKKRRAQTRGTLRSVYADIGQSLGFSASHAMALTRKFLPEHADLDAILSTAPTSWDKLK